MRYGLAACALCAVLARAAAAQEGAPAYSADDLVNILRPSQPIATRGIGARTRSLSPGTGPEVDAGAPGSGVVPDLRILFPFNSADLTPESRAQLDQLGQALVSDGLATFRFELAGHTDAVGGERYNDGLSTRRARAVTAYLESRFGIDPARLQAKGYGKRQLVDPQVPDSPRNRRVEVLTLPQ